ncbi:phosphomevalonate kinase [Lacticigenium naphthae]|uniref:phosphomevalonate kinase n=1 Tax=Lacticigenium naphthae TaxID=515351 RepID=UPI000408634F|nr:phosphomevalonate kinase [Lacticigenium naphthae]
MDTVTASAPGKLYIAGEYAVVEPGYPAILVAVDQFITVRITPAQDEGSIRSFQYGNYPVTWKRENGEIVLDKRENPFHYIFAALSVTEAYMKETTQDLSLYHLTVKSELDSAQGLKYGLGSSAAVTVATIRALLKYYNQKENNQLVFKLAALAHIQLGSNGSFGDIAASTYTGWIAYTSFDRRRLSEKLQTQSVYSLVQESWPLFSVERLIPPDNLRLIIGWTGSPASTTKLVDKVKEQKTTNQNFYHQFLNESRQCVQEMIRGFHENNLSIIQEQIHLNRHLLQQMSNDTNVLIETNRLHSLCEIAEIYGGAAKSSGAGGGDCGIAIFHRHDALMELLADWEKNNIAILPLQVYTAEKSV